MGMHYDHPGLERKRKARIAALFAIARHNGLDNDQLHDAVAAALNRPTVSIASLRLPELGQALDHLSPRQRNDDQPRGPEVAWSNNPTKDQIKKIEVLADILGWHQPGIPVVDPARWKRFGEYRVVGTKSNPRRFIGWTRKETQKVIEALKSMIRRKPELRPQLIEYERKTKGD